MLGAAGCIVPEILATAGVIPQTPAEVTWFRSGVIPPAGVYTKCAALCNIPKLLNLLSWLHATLGTS